MITIKDVAKQAGVSIASVSNYLNNKKNISAKTARTIQQAIDDLNYVVQNSGRELKMKRNQDIGIVFPTISEPYLERLLSSIKGYLSQYDQTFVLELTDSDPRLETKAILNLIGRNVAGMILYTCQPQNREIFEKLEKSGIPYVLIDRRPENFDCNFVTVDNKELFRRITGELLAKNYTRIALVCGPDSYRENIMARIGYETAFENAGKEAEAENIIFTTAIRECGFRAGIQLLERGGQIPQVILTTSYRLAEGLKYALKIYHLDEEEQVQIISTGDSMDDVFHHDNAIVKTSRGAYQIGEEAGKLLLCNIRSPIVFEKQQVVFQDDYNIAHLEPSLEIKAQRPTQAAEEICVLLLDDETSVSGLSRLLTDFYAKENIKVKIKRVLPKDSFEYICNYCESGSSQIDVILFDVPWLAYYADKGYLLCLDELMEAYPLNTSNYLPNASRHYSVYNGRHYALPYMACTQLLFYRKDIFSNEEIADDLERKYMIPLKVPKNWFQFNALAKYFTRKYNPDSPVEFGHSMAVSNPDLFLCDLMPRIWDYGGSLFNRQQALQLNTLQNRKAVRSLLESIQYTSDGLLSKKPADAAVDFINGNTAMFYTFYNYATGLVDRLQSKVVDNFGYTRIPGSSVLSGWSLGISKNSRKAEAAFKFIRWASGSDIAIPHTILGGQSPNISVYRNYDMVSLYPWLPRAMTEFEKSQERLPQTTAKGNVINEDEFVHILYRGMMPLVQEAMEGHTANLEQLEDVFVMLQGKLRKIL